MDWTRIRVFLRELASVARSRTLSMSCAAFFRGRRARLTYCASAIALTVGTPRLSNHPSEIKQLSSFCDVLAEKPRFLAINGAFSRLGCTFGPPLPKERRIGTDRNAFSKSRTVMG